MEPRREHGDDRLMWKTTSPEGAWCVSEHEQDARDVAGEDEGNEFTIEQVLVTAEDWNAMPEFEGW